MAPPSTASRGDRRWWLLAAATSLAVAGTVAFPAWLHPTTSLPCHVVHPDCGGNQWLLAWVADRVLHGEGLLHNDRYYWPVGDTPFLAGNGGEGLLYAPFHLLFGWPVAANLHLLLLVAANGLAAAWAARGAGASWPGAFLAAAAMGASPYVMRELTAGRAVQGDLSWCLWYLGALLRLLEAPSVRRALLAGALLAAASCLYWYHGVFLVLASGILVAGTAPGRWRAGGVRAAVPWRALAMLAATAGVLAAGPLAWYLAHWSLLPGTAATSTFPHPLAVADSLDPTWPFLAREAQDQAVSAVVLLLGAAQLVRVLLGRSNRPWLDLALVGVWGVFFVLALGPAFRVAGVSPFDAVYGLAAPLRRFWWPSRHVAVAQIAVVLLAARAVPCPRRPAAAVVLALGLTALVPAALALQHAPVRTEVTRTVAWPPPFYDEVRRLPGTLALDLPLSPYVAISQKHLLYQLVHRKTLITGHAVWLDRVRPPAWDAFVEGNSFLRGIRRIEEGDPTTTFTFEAADLGALQAAGLGPVIVNAEQFPLVRSQAPRRLRRLFDVLFGRSRTSMSRAWAWDTSGWTGVTAVPVPPFAPSAQELAGLARGDGPNSLYAPASEIFVAIRGGRKGDPPGGGPGADR